MNVVIMYYLSISEIISIKIISSEDFVNYIGDIEIYLFHLDDQVDEKISSIKKGKVKKRVRKFSSWNIKN